MKIDKRFHLDSTRVSEAGRITPAAPWILRVKIWSQLRCPESVAYKWCARTKIVTTRRAKLTIYIFKRSVDNSLAYIFYLSPVVSPLYTFEGPARAASLHVRASWQQLMLCKWIMTRLGSSSCGAAPSLFPLPHRKCETCTHSSSREMLTVIRHIIHT